MSPARLLGLLQAGDPIIVRGGWQEPTPVPAGAIRYDGLAARTKTPRSRKLSAAIAFRKEGKKS